MRHSVQSCPGKGQAWLQDPAATEVRHNTWAMCINIRPTGCRTSGAGTTRPSSHAPRAYAVSRMLIAPSGPKLTSKGGGVVIIGLGRGKRRGKQPRPTTLRHRLEVSANFPRRILES
jgi:hypothetical protein